MPELPRFLFVQSYWAKYGAGGQGVDQVIQVNQHIILTACQSPLLSNLMLLVNTSHVFQHMLSFLSNVWLFDAYATLVSMPSACLKLVKETSQMLIYSVSSQSHAKHTILAFIFTRIRLKQRFYLYYFFAAWFVFITYISDLVQCLFFFNYYRPQTDQQG